MRRHIKVLSEITNAVGKCKAQEILWRRRIIIAVSNVHIHIPLTLAYFHPLETTRALWINVLQCYHDMQKVNMTKMKEEIKSSSPSSFAQQQ